MRTTLHYFRHHFPLLAYILFLSFLLGYIMNFASVNDNSGMLDSTEAWREHLQSNIYRYRVLGREVVQVAYDLLFWTKMQLHPNYTDADAAHQTLRHALFLVNATFAWLTATCVYMLFTSRMYEEQNLVNKGLWATFLTLHLLFIIGITQFVITPYDCLSYFFMALCFALGLRAFGRPKQTHYAWILAGVMVLATLVRETSVLALTALFAVGIQSDSLPFRRLFRSLLPAALAFAAVYVGLRFYLGFEGAIVGVGHELVHRYNFFMVPGWMGIFFLVSNLLWVSHLAKTVQNRRAFGLFLLFSFPYLFICFYTGYLYEMRLSVPLILLGTLMTRLDLGCIAVSRTT